VTAVAQTQILRSPAAEVGRRFWRDRVGRIALLVVLAFGVLIAAVAWGELASDWASERALPHARPALWAEAPLGSDAAVQPDSLSSPQAERLDLSAIDPLSPRRAEWDRRTAELRTTEPVRAGTLPLGADRLGRDVLAKALRGTQVSVSVGVLAALLAVGLGTLLGAIAGYRGGWAGAVLESLYSVFTAIPGILLILAFAAVLGRGPGSVVLILGLTGWTTVYRLVRAEFMRHARRDHVLAAEALGVGPLRRMVRHILPSVMPVVLVQLSLHVIGFIKYEVILSYLGLGVAIDQVSWGTMLAEAQGELLLGVWWQLAVATTFMALFVTAFSLMTDALRDALDPSLPQRAG
jgi:oligopeptide transport system permease protein